MKQCKAPWKVGFDVVVSNTLNMEIDRSDVEVLVVRCDRKDGHRKKHKGKTTSTVTYQTATIKWR
jgi:hypothetical protein